MRFFGLTASLLALAAPPTAPDIVYGTGRVALPGLFPMRVDMLVVPSVIGRYVLITHELTQITTAAFVLKRAW